MQLRSLSCIVILLVALPCTGQKDSPSTSPVVAQSGAAAATQSRERARVQGVHHRILLDVSTVLYDGWAQAITNSQNLLATFGASNVEIEVVVRGPGLAMLMKSDTEFAEKLGALSKQGVQFVACGQTLEASHSSAQDLFPFAEVVDSGVAELVRRQETGWSYIKSGY